MPLDAPVTITTGFVGAGSTAAFLTFASHLSIPAIIIRPLLP
jgi:hypothetical protein